MIHLEYVHSIGLNQSGQDLCCLSVDSTESWDSVKGQYLRLLLSSYAPAQFLIARFFVTV